VRVLILIAACVAGGAQPAFAQGDRAYVNVSGGMAIAPDATSGNILGEVGVRVARNLFVFGGVGQIHNLQPSLIQPTIDATSAALADSGVTVTGTGRVPAWQTLGGVRYLIPMRSGLTPYVLGGAGVARLSPTAEFTYTSGPLPDGSTATLTPFLPPVACWRSGVAGGSASHMVLRRVRAVLPRQAVSIFLPDLPGDAV